MPPADTILTQQHQVMSRTSLQKQPQSTVGGGKSGLALGYNEFYFILLVVEIFPRC
jgi:hypothetical protein